MDYLLMNKDVKLLSFRTETSVLGTKITEIASYSDRRPHGRAGMEQWIEARNYAKHKDHFRSMLKEWQMDTPDGFLRISHALSLNDTFEIKAFAPLFDFNRSMLCFATEADLETDAALADYFERNDVGHMLGGDFVEIAHAFMTPERKARMPRTISLPGHSRYNLPNERMTPVMTPSTMIDPCRRRIPLRKRRHDLSKTGRTPVRPCRTDEPGSRSIRRRCEASLCYNSCSADPSSCERALAFYKDLPLRLMYFYTCYCATSLIKYKNSRDTHNYAYNWTFFGYNQIKHKAGKKGVSSLKQQIAHNVRKSA